MDATFATLVRDVRSAEEMEVMLVGSNAARSRIATAKGNKNRKLATTSAANPPAASVCVDPVVAAAERVKRVVEVVHEARKKQRPDEVHDCSDDVLCEMARYTDMFALKSYERFLEYVPRIVNVVRRQPTRRFACLLGLAIVCLDHLGAGFVTSRAHQKCVSGTLAVHTQIQWQLGVDIVYHGHSVCRLRLKRHTPKCSMATDRVV